MVQQTLAYAPAPVNNPLKGLVPYSGNHPNGFPHSMEFNYLAVSDVVVGPGQYEWRPLEKLLNEIAGRGHQAIVRFYLEYPALKGGIPSFLLRTGLKTTEWRDPNANSPSPIPIQTPDYENPDLRRTLQAFIAALGKRYDGDARIGFLTAGLLGLWGEWHDYPRSELFASARVQAEVMDAYERAFRKTPVLLRYPRNASDRAYAANDARPFGYHDDSFAWATLSTGKKGDEWYFLPAMQAAGAGALAKWKTQPIGGEIRPEAWGKVFDASPGDARIQNFRRCVEETHVTWLMDSGMFGKEATPERKTRAEEEVRRMGYEFHVSSVLVASTIGGRHEVRLTVMNRGVAPFYYEWPARWGLLTANGDFAKILPSGNRTSGEKSTLTHTTREVGRLWNEMLDLRGIKPGRYKLLVQVPNPLPNGLPVRFANQTQDADKDGWLTLTSLVL